jgi:undecaprenyl-diphosphatase
MRVQRGDVLVGLAWAALAALFAGACVWAHQRYFWPGDLRLTTWVQELRSDRFPLAEYAFKVASGMGDLEVIGAILVVLIAVCAVQRRWIEAAIFIGAGATRWVQVGVRAIVDRPQENPDPPPPPQLYPNAGSFPSGHAFGEVLAYGLIFVLVPRFIRDARIVMAVRILCVAEIVIGAPARLYTGAHWPSDLVGGAMLALLYMIPALWLDRRLQRKNGDDAAVELPTHALAELPAERAAHTIDA